MSRWVRWGIVAVCVCWTDSPAVGTTLVREGRPAATIVVPDRADRGTEAAAELLARYVARATGATLPLAREGSDAAKDAATTVYLGPCAALAALKVDLAGLDEDGFVIHVAASGPVVIAGPTAHGTEFGVCEFLERFVGVRWLLPGPEGDDVPEASTLEVPAGTIRQEPAFFSRALSGLQGAAQLEWARRNRMRGRVEFHHHLNKLFPPETYADGHPEFYPVRKGQRYRPTGPQEHGWQPCFSAPGLAEAAAESIIRHFDRHPEASSYSLGTNDSSGFCQCEACGQSAGPDKNFLGLVNHSDAYFRWCNQVAEKVLQKHPGKWFGCLAYSEVAQAPQHVRLHPRIIPFMTYDRMKWIDHELQAEGHAMTRRWQASAATLGWYDYIYGSPFCVPRVWFREMADYYRFGHAHGVRALYAEAYPNWGEGPKLYVSLKLQWDPHRDAEQLLQEWCSRCVGRDGAADLSAYFRHWEDFWTRRILQSKWFSRRGQYLPFYHPGYLADVTDDDVARSRRWLEAAHAKARTAPQRNRAALLLKTFEYYEASALAYSARNKAQGLVIRNAQDALTALEEAQRLLGAGRKRLDLLEEFSRHPVLRHPLDLERFPLLRGETWGGDLLWPVFDQAAREDGAVRARLRALAGAADVSLARQAAMMLALLPPVSRPSVAANPVFATEGLRWPNEWSRWIRDRGGRLEMSAAAGRDGAPGVLIGAMARGGPYQDVPVAPGHYGAVALVRVPRPVAAGATVTMSLAPLTEKRQTLRAIATTVAASAGDWQRIAAVGEVPAGTAADPVRRLRICVIFDGFGPQDEAYLAETVAVRLDAP